MVQLNTFIAGSRIRFERAWRNSDWPAYLPWVMLGLRAAPSEDSGISTAELVYSLVCVSDESHRVLPLPASTGTQRLQEAYRGPYRVLVPREKYFVLEVRSRPCPFSASNLKPHLGRPPAAQVPSPSRGRPRKLAP
jgi:hypothetical protein